MHSLSRAKTSSPILAGLRLGCRLQRRGFPIESDRLELVAKPNKVPDPNGPFIGGEDSQISPVRAEPNGAGRPAEGHGDSQELGQRRGADPPEDHKAIARVGREVAS